MARRGSALAIGLLLCAAGGALWLLAPAQDAALYRLLHVATSARMLPLLVRLTDVGGAAIMIPVGLAAAIWLAARRQPARALWLVATVASGRILVELAKLAFARARPPIADRLVAVSSASFPSSHSAGTALTCLAICLALAVGRGVWAAALIVTVSIGLTRVALGVHWPSDVLAGWGFGLVWVALLSARLPQEGAMRVKQDRGAT